MFKKLLDIVLLPFRSDIISNQRGNTLGQAIMGVVGIAVSFIPGVNIAWYVGLGIGLALGGILFPATVKSPKMKPGGLNIQTSQYGIPVPVVYGTRKIAGNLIWYGNFQSHEVEAEGGKGGSDSQVIGYTYTVGLAFGLCMAPPGRRMHINKAWAGKNETSLERISVYNGSQTSPDSYLAGFVSRAPVWKNLCYVVLRDYDLGNSTQPPNFTFEVTTGENQGWFTRVGAILLESPGETYLCSVADTARGFIYYGTWTSPGKIIKVDMKTFTKVGVITLPSDLNNIVSGVIDVVNGFAYFATQTANKIVRINLNTFAHEGTLEIPGSNNLRGAVKGGKYAYFGSWASPGKIVKIHLPSFTYVNTLTLETGENNPVCGVIDTDEGYAYFGTNTTPAKIIQIHLESFTRTNAITLDSGENIIDCGVIDTSRGYAYFGTTGTTSKIVKVKIPTRTNPLQVLQRVVAIELPTEESNPRCVAINPGANIAYFSCTSTGNVPSRIVKIDLSTFEHAGTLILDYGDWEMRTIDIDPYSGFLYLGNWYIAPRIVQVGIDRHLTNMLPTDITRDIITNDLYSLGLDAAKLDLVEYENTSVYCAANELLISPLFDGQISVLDALQHVISHHNGYISYFNGLIAHKQLKKETPISELTIEHTVKEEDSFPVNISRSGGRDYNNKILLEYTKRDQDHVIGTVSTDDTVDIDKYGLKDATVKLDGITVYSMASKMANLLLKKSLANPLALEFKLGPKSLGIKPGDVYAITDSTVELSNMPIRISTISEGDDYNIETVAAEEVDVYDLIEYGSDTITPPPPPDIYGDPLSVVNPLLLEVPAIYSQSVCSAAVVYSKSSSASWAGASVHRAYTSGGTYNALAVERGSGITGTVNAVGFVNGLAYMDVLLDWGATLSSAVSFDDLITTPRKNLFFVRTATGDKFCKYQNVSLIAARTWRLTGLIYDLVDAPQLNTSGIAAVANNVGLYASIPHMLTFEASDKFRTLYFKLPSFNFGGLAQDMSGLTPISLAIAALCDKPLQPTNMIINTFGVNEGGTVVIAAGDIAIAWTSRNRFNSGGNSFTRTDTIVDDTDFVNFELEIYTSTTLLRTVTQTAKAYTYTTALQTTDGGPYGSYTLKIRQINTLASSGQTITNITTI